MKNQTGKFGVCRGDVGRISATRLSPVRALAAQVLLLNMLGPVAHATPSTYSYSHYSSTPGFMGWSYWDSLGQQMVWNTSTQRWTCSNSVDQWCFWSPNGGHPGADRNVIRRWSAPSAGSARITGIRQKDTNVCGGTLVSVGKPSSQSSCNGANECWGGTPNRCNDGNTNGSWSGGSVCHTNNDAQAWYQIDLQQTYVINRIEVYNRLDNTSGEADRVTNFNVMTSVTGAPGSWESTNYPGKCGYPTTTTYPSGRAARYVKVQLVGTNILNLAEVLVYADGPDGVRALSRYRGRQSNYYLTSTTPGPPHDFYMGGGASGSMGCSDASPYSFDWDQEIYPGDSLDFTIDRNNNYSWDSTTFQPTITFEPADAIGSLETYSSATATTATVAFDGFLKCPNGSTCGYTSTFPPDYYTVSALSPAPYPPWSNTTRNNYALCGPADGPFCLNTAPPRFSVSYPGLTPNKTYKFKVQAWRGGHLYGQSKIITLQTGAIAPPALTPSVTLSTLNPEYNATDVVISWEAPAAPLDRPAAFERFELYRQALSSQAPISSQGVVQGYGTGEQLCAALPQGGTSGQKQELTCLSTTARDGSCSVSFNYGNATCVAWDPPVLIGYSKWDRNNAMQLWVNTAEQGSPTRRTDLSTALVTSVTDPGVDRKPTTYRYFVVARYKPAYASQTEKSEVSAKIALPRPAVIAGFADAHVHQFGNLAHGGTLLDGRPGDADDGTTTYNSNPVDLGGFSANATGLALRGCGATSGGGTGNHEFGTIGNIALDLAGSPYSHDRSGIKELPRWIHHANSLHQQGYKTALKRAVDGGLRLMVMHAVNSEFVCKVAALVRNSSTGFSPISCDDSVSLDLQIRAAYRLQSEIDRAYCPDLQIPDVGLPNTYLSSEGGDHECGWYRIVTTPAAARKVMNRGKLAVILGMEAATPFDCGTGTSGPWAAGSPSYWPNTMGTRPTCKVGGPGPGLDILDPLDSHSLQYFYNLGIRHLFPIHGINNGLGSTGISPASDKYGFNEAALNGAYFRTGGCANRGSGVDGPLNFRLSLPVSSTTVTMPLGLGTLAFTNVAGIPLPPGGYPGGTGATCNIGGPVGSTGPAFGLTPLGRSVIQEMMKRRMIIDVDHMSELSHVDTVAESAKAFNYPLVSGHTTLQSLSTGNEKSPGANEVALSTPELNEVRASGGQVNLVALAAAFKAEGTKTHERKLKPEDPDNVANDCDDSDKVWAQQYLAAVNLTRNAPVPSDNSAPPVRAVGFGSDFNTIGTMLQPRFGYVDGVGYSGCSRGGEPGPTMTTQQQAQWDANGTGGVGKAVQYDVDMISGATTTPGHGGIDTSLPADPENNFPGFNGPRLRRSRLNEGGYLFTLYGPDKAGPVTPTMCLDNGNNFANGTPVLIGDCGNTRNIGQQWHYDAAPSLRIRPVPSPRTNIVVDTSIVDATGDFAVVMADSDVFTNYSNPPPAAKWTQLASGQLVNGLTGRCLSVQSRGRAHGSRVVASPCGGGNTGLPMRPDQLWARGSEEESFNRTGLHHIGMYPDLIQDLKNIGLTNRDLIPLFQSAEGYLQMWERTGWTKPIDYTKLSSNGSWKYVTTAPPSGWQNVAFDDTSWRTVADDSTQLAAFGAAPWNTGMSGFPNPTPARWMPIADGNYTYYFRKTFVTDKVGTPKTVTVSSDDSASVYLDGALKVTTGPWTTASSFTFTPSAHGTHVIAVSATNSGGPGGLIVDVR